jgi:hypothetical protein
MPRIDVGDQFAMTAVEISDEGVSRADYSRRAQPFEPAHGPQSGFQAAVRCTVRTFTGRCRARYVVPHACHKRGQQRSMEVTPDHSWPQAKACSRASLEGSQAPDQHRCLRWAFAPGWLPDWGWVVVGVTRARVSRRVGARGIAGQVQGVYVVQPLGAPHGPLSLARFEASSPTRRDTRFPPSYRAARKDGPMVIPPLPSRK